MPLLSKISSHFHIKQGFCHPDWEAISGIIDTSFPEPEWGSAWQLAARRWVDLIRDKLGGNYQVYETPNFMILSAAPIRVINDACRSYEDFREQILESLDGVASDEGYGKHVVLMFSSAETYYDYITYFYSDGEHSMSTGICLQEEGYVHFAFPATDFSSYKTVLVHELTHGCLGHLPIPVWLNEALAMRMEEVICQTPTFHFDQETYDKHVAHWDEDTIQQFWSGTSWGIPGDSVDLSYNLAQLLWRKIEADLGAPRAAILQLISKAYFDDAGENAFREIFDLSLGDLVMDFLGEGNWAPNPEKWTTIKEDIDR